VADVGGGDNRGGAIALAPISLLLFGPFEEVEDVLGPPVVPPL